MTALLICSLCSIACKVDNYVGLTVVPYGTVTDQITLDIRAGLINYDKEKTDFDVELWLNGDTLLEKESISLMGGGDNCCVKYSFPAAGLSGDNCLTLKVWENGKLAKTENENFKVIPSDVRTDKQIDGAWCGIYHWSEQEGLHWNKDIAKMSDSQWKELVRAMHSIRMDAVVIQEVFRNQEYVGGHNMSLESYSGKAFYPSKLYPARMDNISAKDPVEAILSQADELDMKVMLGVGMWAWFDFSPMSLEWHKKIARELWEMYGHHKSFYAFYISEECDGSLTTYDPDPAVMQNRKEEIVHFFKEMKEYCATLAPDKPLMLATNSMNITQSLDVYPRLLQNLDILCPFGFARMPENDLSGKEAADLLQSLCDEAGSHLWFDLEAFLFNPDMSLYPKPIEQIISELRLLDNFEKVLTYQFPGVFNDPEMSIQIGEDRTVQLFLDYRDYLKKLDESNK